MRLTKHQLIAALAGLASLVTPALAVFDPVNDDTDIFLANPNFSSARPNVLIFIDNTANWSQTGTSGTAKFTNEKAALVSVVNGLSDGFNVGVGMFVETGGGNDTIDGAYIRFAVRQMTSANKTALTSLLTALDETTDKGNNATPSLAMYEMYRYFRGEGARAGLKVKRDYAGNTSSNPYAASVPGNAFIDSISQTYVSPIVDGCQKNFIIYISNGQPNENTSALSTAQGLLQGISGGTLPSQITLSPTGQEGNWMDEYARFMANSDCNAALSGTQVVYTYVIEIDKSATGQGPATSALMQSTASVGKGRYFAVTNNVDAIKVALNTIFQEVQSVNSVFASTTLPVSVNVRGTNLNQVYIGVFRPDSAKSPRWFGNLKLYKLGLNRSNNTLYLADSLDTATNPSAAENASTGFISNSAVSYWTTDTGDFWAFRSPDYASTDVGKESDYPDGDLVEKGGAAQRLREAFPGGTTSTEIAQITTDRKVYTCTGVIVSSTNNPLGLCALNASLSATQFNTLNALVTAGDLGAYRTTSVSSITSSGTTATVTTSGAHGFAGTPSIRITGASPSSFNGDFTIAVTGATTFTYTLPSALSGTTAVVSATGHGLLTNDLVSVSGATPNEYNTSTDQVVARIDANTFTYSLSSSASTSSTGQTVLGKKAVTAIVGSGTTANATVPAHGFTTATVTLASICCATPTAFNKSSSFTATVINANTLRYTTDSTITGTSNTASITTAAASPIEAGDQVVVAGASPSGYNGTFTVTSVSGNTFSYTLATSVTGAITNPGAVGVTIIRGRTLNDLINGTTNPTRNDMTGTTSTAHGVDTTWTVTVSGVTDQTSYNVTDRALTAAAGSTFNYTTSSNNASNVFLLSASPTGLTVTFKKALGAGAVASGVTTNISATANPSIYIARTLTGASISVQAVATGTITAGDPTIADTAEREALINWVRGQDNKDNEDEDGVPTDIRASVHGDVLHSRPAVINYNRNFDYTNSDATVQSEVRDSDIYAFYGSNDGMLHAIKGGTRIAPSGVNADGTVTPGVERWAFIPREFFPKLKRLRDQYPSIGANAQKSYFFDGSIGVYQKDVTSSTNSTPNGIIRASDGDKVYLYVAMRRGGRAVFALDVTDPSDPKFLWRKGNTDTGWGELGYTFSEPKVAKVRASIGNTNNPDNIVLVFGAGYDPAVEDLNPCLIDTYETDKVTKFNTTGINVTYTSAGTCTFSSTPSSTIDVNRTMGRGILVVDAFNGNVVWQAGKNPTGAGTNVSVSTMTYAIPSDTAAIDIGREGFIDRVYVGDLGGQVWRVDLSGATVSDWTVTRIAKLRGTSSAGQRKFLFAPDVVFDVDTTGNYAAVLLGSGDREHPFDAIINNRFYMLKDRGTSTLIGRAGDANGVYNATTTPGVNEFGWQIDLGDGEKTISSSVTLAGTTFFNTNQPSAQAALQPDGSCGSNLGIARQYLVSFANSAGLPDLTTTSIGGTTRSTVSAGGGYLPSPVPAVVEIDGRKFQTVISGTSVRTPVAATLEVRTKVYWYKDLD